MFCSKESSLKTVCVCVCVCSPKGQTYTWSYRKTQVVVQHSLICQGGVTLLQTQLHRSQFTLREVCVCACLDVFVRTENCNVALLVGTNVHL